MLEALSQIKYEGKVLVFGPRASLMATAMLSIGEKLGLAMLPLLPTPFNDGDLRNRVAILQPIEAPPKPPVDVAEALHANWLELWYQPKIEARFANAEQRRSADSHAPPDLGHRSASSLHTRQCRSSFQRFVGIRRGAGRQGLASLRHRARQYRTGRSICRSPFFQHPMAIEKLARHMPTHPAFEGLIVEISSDDLIRHSAAGQASGPEASTAQYRDLD